MQLISGYLDTVAPYTYLLWIVPAALILYFLGWLVRGIELTSTVREHNQKLTTREQELKKLAAELDGKEQLLREIQTKNANERASLDALEKSSHLLQLSLDDARSESEQLHHDKTIALHRLDESTIQLEHTQYKLEKYQKATQEYEEKFSALRTKYKQRDAKLYGEIVELRAYIFDLKAAILQAEKERQKLQESAAQLDPIDGNATSTDENLTSALEESTKEIEQLQALNREHTARHLEELSRLKENLTSIEALEKKLKQQSDATKQAKKELQEGKEQHEKLVGKLQQVTETSQLEIRQYAKQQSILTLKYKDLQIESRREIEALKTRIKQLNPLATINKNQLRTIQSLESQLQHQRKHAKDFQTQASSLLSAQAELEKLKIRVESTSSTLDENSKQLTATTDKLQQSQFENRKIPSLHNQLREKNKKLGQLDTDLLKLTQALHKARSEKIDHERQSSVITTLKRKNDENDKVIQQLERKLSESRQLEEKLTEKEQNIATLNEQLTQLRSRNQSLLSSESRLAALQTTLQRRDSDLSALKQEHEQELQNSQVDLQALEEKCKQIEPLQQALLQSEKKAKEMAGELNRLRVDLAVAEKQQQDQPQLTAVQHALDSSEAKHASLEQQIEQLQAQLLEQEALRKRLQQLEPLNTELEQAENKIKELSAELTLLRQQSQDQVTTLTQLQQTVADLQPKAAKLAESESRVATLSARIDEQLVAILKIPPLEQEVKRLNTALQQAERTAARKAKAVTADAEQDRPVQNQTTRNTSAEPHQESELENLRNQVSSLTRERDLGLERVKELSESARTLTEKEQLIKQLRQDLQDVKFDQREIDTLRGKIDRHEQELIAKNLAIEELKRMLRHARKPVAQAVSAQQPDNRQHSPAIGPAVKKTATHRVLSSTGRISKDSRDDLKKIRGIGPVMEKLLNEQGITRYQQIAEFTPNDIEKLSEALDTFSDRVTRDDWVGGARREQKKKYG